MKKNLIAIVSLIAVTLFISLKSIAQQIDPINDAEITITKENTKVTKPMGTAEDKANTKTLRRLTVTLDGVEVKDKITPAHSDKNLFMVRTEDSPLIMITEQIDNKYGQFFMSFSGTLDSAAQGTGSTDGSSSPSFLGKAKGNIKCNNEFKEIDTSIVWNPSLNDVLYAGCQINTDSAAFRFLPNSYTTLNELIDFAKSSLQIPLQDGTTFVDCGAIYFYVSGKSSVKKETNKCPLCLGNELGISLDVYYKIEQPIIYHANWLDVSLAGPITQKYYNEFIDDIIRHENVHFCDFLNLVNTYIKPTKHQKKCCKNYDFKSFNKLNTTPLKDLFKDEIALHKKAYNDYLVQKKIIGDLLDNGEPVDEVPEEIKNILLNK